MPNALTNDMLRRNLSDEIAHTVKLEHRVLEMEQALGQLQHLASTPEGLSNTKLVHTILTEVGYEPKHTLNNGITHTDLKRALTDIAHLLDDELSKSHSVSSQTTKEIQAIVGAALRPKVEEKNSHAVDHTESVRSVSIARMVR
jgi:hypothetical protein